MGRIYPPHQPIGAPRALAILAALGGLMIALPSWASVGGTLQPRPVALLKKANPLKTLPTLKTPKPGPTPSMNSFVSPYARAAAQRNESGRLPPGHPYVPPRPAANPADRLAQ